MQHVEVRAGIAAPIQHRIVRGGLPIRDHLGEVVFEPSDGGALATWRCHFVARAPGLGRVIQAFSTRLFRPALRGLARRLA